ncbi:hypothetical protein CTAYLR_000017 [Chrysophaeum taylorii]|uniref:GST N-terminal domain-containing protein n=1 Tax=Chrysophaeum taylorii TaxID=2483200 RepID=A0AAD7XK33_9STRA|nr:hypothetical protein CTAYLR_000017 [Chrysophaeum taylorii]
MLLLVLFFVRSSSAAAAAPSWSDLSAALPSLSSPPAVVIDTVHHVTPPEVEGIVLYRERNGWCPYSERAWLALELTGATYTTVLIDNIGGRPPWFSGTTPRLRWSDGTETGESMDIAREVDEKLGNGTLYAARDVKRVVAAFRDTFPRGTRPSSRSAFLFRGNGPVPRREFERTLAATDELIALRGGPFLCGPALSAADVAWAPFLERYDAQLPLLHPGLSSRSYPRLAAWFDAMDACPEYFARVKGDHRSWAKVLRQAGFGNAGIAPKVSLPETVDDPGDLAVWRAYARGRNDVGTTPSREVATRLVRNRDAILRDAVRTGAVRDLEVADDGLRRCVAYFLDDDAVDDPDNANAALVARYLSDRVCVPRDMGAPPAAALHALNAKLSSY